MQRRPDGKACPVLEMDLDEAKVEQAFVALLLFLRDGVYDPAVVHVNDVCAWTVACFVQFRLPIVDGVPVGKFIKVKVASGSDEWDWRFLRQSELECILLRQNYWHYSRSSHLELVHLSDLSAPDVKLVIPTLSYWSWNELVRCYTAHVGTVHLSCDAWWDVASCLMAHGEKRGWWMEPRMGDLIFNLYESDDGEAFWKLVPGHISRYWCQELRFAWLAACVLRVKK